MENLKTLREASGLSQQKVAEQTNLTQQKIHAYESGAYEPDINTMKTLADFFETSLDYLVGRTDIKRKIEPVSEYSLNENEKALVDSYRKLPQNQRASLTNFLETLISG